MEIRTLVSAGYNLWEGDCVTTSGIECVTIIWNGTGVEDIGGDWSHQGDGTEEAYAKYSGTNGLHVVKNSSFARFIGPYQLDVSDYTMLSMWVKPLEWTVGDEISVYFNVGYSLDLSAYMNTLSNEWQRVLVPLADFGLPNWGDPGATVGVKQLNLNSNGNIQYYTDDISLVIGTTVYESIPVCHPDMDAFETEPTEPRIDTKRGIHVRAFPPPNLEARRKYIP